MSRGRRRGSRSALIALVTCLVMVAGMGATAPSPAQGAGKQIFVLDQALSLTGGTGVSELDPIHDPGPSHPSKSFNDPCGVATDAYGNVYVANGAFGSQHEVEGEVVYDGVIDVFGSDGKFITQVVDQKAPCAIAVDSSGRLYADEGVGTRLVRFDPTTYEPAAGDIEYDPTPVVVAEGSSYQTFGLDPSESGPYKDRLYVARPSFETKSPIESFLPDGSLAESFFEDGLGRLNQMAVWSKTHDLYIPGFPFKPFNVFEGQVMVLDGTTHEPKFTLKGFGFEFGKGGVAVDQENGDIYVTDVTLHHWVTRFDAEGNEIEKLSLPGNGLKGALPFSAVAVDRGAHSPNQGYVYVTSGSSATDSHLYTFEPIVLDKPEIQATEAKSIGEGEALLSAEVNPHGAATSYRFEYGTEDCAASACQSIPVPEGALALGGSFKAVSAAVTGLEAGTRYHFRVVATNHCNPVEPGEECTVDGPDATFTTFPPPPAQSCANEAFRVGASTGLPDCRAYELVTPADTGGRIPTGAVFGSGTANSPAVQLARGDGASVVWGTEGGTVPGSPGSGRYDTYLSTRTPSGWSSEFGGITGEQANESYPGAVSDDHQYSLWVVRDKNGSLEPGWYLRGPGGEVEPVGIGSLGEDHNAVADWISVSGGHVVFTSNAQLEPGAPPSGTDAIYDRDPGGATHVVSLFPGEVTPTANDGGAVFLGAVGQGGTIAFRIGKAIYLRIGDTETIEVTDGPATFAGLSADGSHAFYVQGGDVFAFDVSSESATPVGSGGKSTPVNISADGSHVYFVSPTILSGTEANGQGEEAQAGEENLYVWDGSTESVRFVAIVEEEDVIGVPPPGGGGTERIGGLGLWTSDAVANLQGRFVGPANDPSRTTAGGSTLVFESRAQLTGYRNEGHSEVYRYDAASGALGCVSCNPTEIPATADGRLESHYAPLLSSLPPVSAITPIQNVALGGDAVFFQSAERLAFGDGDGKLDVYEWKADGVEGCEREAGCVELISSGRSSSDDYLYGATPDAKSVFFLSGDMLVDEDLSSTPSIYAARVDGGFPPPPAPPTPCAGEACQPGAPGPQEISPGSASFIGPGNAAPAKGCPARKRKVRGGKKNKTRCVKRHVHHRRKARRAGAERGTSR